MPPTNPARRQALTDAAIDLLASRGVHGLTHRAVEKKAGLPPGTASNYFRSREALLVAAAERIAELHHADADRAVERHRTAEGASLADLLTASLLTAATTLRDRYLAIFELRLEAVRRPALASALAALQDTSARFTAGQHDDLGLAIPRERIPALIALYGGALFSMVTAPPGSVGRDVAQGVARVIVHGCIAPRENSRTVRRGHTDSSRAVP